MFIDQLEYPEKHKNEIGALPDSLYRQSFSAVPSCLCQLRLMNILCFSAFLQNDKLLSFFSVQFRVPARNRNFNQ